MPRQAVEYKAVILIGAEIRDLMEGEAKRLGHKPFLGREGQVGDELRQHLGRGARCSR
jgi:hypothetical protein